MKNNLRKSTVAAVIAFALTASISFSVHAETLGDLTAVATLNQNQAGFDSAIRGATAEFTTAYEGAMAGTPITFTQSAAVILQSGGGATALLAADGNFAFIEQIGVGVTDFNYASIDQTTASNNAYILQTDGQNYASIVQSGAVSTVAYISQAGFGNRAIINQK